jgi:hypothetical protein
VVGALGAVDAGGAAELGRDRDHGVAPGGSHAGLDRRATQNNSMRSLTRRATAVSAGVVNLAIVRPAACRSNICWPTKGYDANWLRARVAETGAAAVIPSTRSRSQAIPYDKYIYKERNLVERLFNKITHYRRIATRYEKTRSIVRSHVILGRRNDLALL